MRAGLLRAVLPVLHPLPYAGAPEPEPEQPEPGSDATDLLLLEAENRRLEDENRRLRATVQELEGTVHKLEGILRCIDTVVPARLRAEHR